MAESDLARRVERVEDEVDDVRKDLHDNYVTKEQHADLRKILYWLVGTFITVVGTIFATSVKLKFGG